MTGVSVQRGNDMRKHLVLCGIVAFVLARAALAETINVKEFGAKGDGVTDDTAAIQAAFDEAFKRVVPFNVRGAWEASYPEILFPEGTYILTNLVRVSNGGHVRGEGNVILKQTNPQAGVLDCHWALRFLIENITFEGGRVQLNLFSCNNHAYLFVRGCTFRNSGDFAVTCVTKGTAQDKQTGAFYEKQEDGSYAYRNSPDDPYWYNSTILHIDDCRFENCMKVLHDNTDKGVMTNCTIETNPDMKGAAIVAIALKLENIEGRAHVTPGNNQRWIDHRGIELVLKNVHLKTASDTGMCAVYTHNRYNNTSQGGAQHYVIIDGSEFQSAGSPENAIVYCREIPNMIVIRDSREVSDGAVNAIGFEKVPDADYFKQVSPDGLKFITSARNSENIRTALPPSMRPYVDTPLPEEVAELFVQDTPAVGVAMKQDFHARTIRITDFESAREGKNDWADAIQKAVNAAAEDEGAEVVFPDGHYTVSKTIELPAEISLRGVGGAYLNGEGAKVLFRAKDGKRLAFSNLIIGNSETAIDVTAKDEAEAHVLIDHCLFGGTKGMAVRCGTEAMKIAEENKIHLRITDSVFTLCRQVLETNARQAVFDSSWVATDNKMLNQAAIVNKGNLLFKDIAGVPYCEDWNADHRWIDNACRVTCDNVRFGGEFAGMCLVNQRSHAVKCEPRILIENGWLYSIGNERRKVAVYLERVPDIVALRTNTGCSGGTTVVIGLAARAKSQGRAVERRRQWFFTSGNTVLVNNPYK
jgi:hypothetical protein